MQIYGDRWFIPKKKNRSFMETQWATKNTKRNQKNNTWFKWEINRVEMLEKDKINTLELQNSLNEILKCKRKYE